MIKEIIVYPLITFVLVIALTRLGAILLRAVFPLILSALDKKMVKLRLQAKMPPELKIVDANKEKL